MELLGYTLDVIGKLLVAFTAVQTHYRIWQEHKIDKKVFASMKRERLYALIGIALIIIGFVIQLPYKAHWL